MLDRSLLRRVSDLERTIEEMQAVLNSRDSIYVKVDELFKAVFGEEPDSSAMEGEEPFEEEQEEILEGWVIVSPNPPRMKGIDHYWMCDPEEDYSTDTEERSDRWTGILEYTWKFPNKVTAKKHLKLLQKEKDYYFRGREKSLRLAYITSKFGVYKRGPMFIP